MPEASNPVPLTAAEPFPSLAELWQAHLDLRQPLSKGDRVREGSRRTAAEVRAFIARARATGATLADESERKTAQSVLDYWSTELLSLPGTTAEDFAPALLAPLDEMRVSCAQGEPAEAEKKAEDESRELVRTAATARLWRDSGKQYGYLLLDKVAIAQAARFRDMDPDIAELVTESEDAYRALERRKSITLYGAIGAICIFALGVVILVLAMRAGEAERKARASIDSVERISNVLSRQVYAGAIPVAAAAELFKEAENILASGGPRPELTEAHAQLLIQFSDVYLAVGNDEKALALAEQAGELADQLVRQDPGNRDWKTLVYQSAFRIGDLLEVSDSGRAKREFDQALKIAQEFAAAAPGDDPLLQDVAFVNNKIGDLDLLRGDWQQALSKYRESLAIGDSLAAAKPRNPVALKISADARERAGFLFSRQKRIDDAIAEHQEALKIRTSLAEATPKDDRQYDVYQGNLASSYHRIGDLYQDGYKLDKNADKLERARQQYEKALPIREGRANKDPSNASLQNDLQHEYVAIADVLLVEPNVPGALEQYGRALVIGQRLAAADPGNANWKAYVADMHEKLSEAFVRDRQFDAALGECTAALEIRKRLAGQFPDKRDRQTELATAYERMGDTLEAQGKSKNEAYDRRDAVDAYQQGLAVIEALIRKDPGSGLAPVREGLQKKIEGPASRVQ